MTREEVMTLSDEELQIKAAELAGWSPPEHPEETPDRYTFHSDPGDMWYGVPGSDGREFYIEFTEFNKGFLWHTRGGERGQTKPPDYPHDIVAAMSLWNEANKKRCSLALVALLWQGKVSVFDSAIEIDVMGWPLRANAGEDVTCGLVMASARDRTCAFLLAMTQGGEDAERQAQEAR